MKSMLGPYMIGAIIPRCFDPSKRVRKIALDCLQQLLRILALYEGLSTETIEQALTSIQSVNVRCNGDDVNGGKLDINYVSQALVSLLGERIQHQHILSLLDSCVETVIDTQVPVLSSKNVLNLRNCSYKPIVNIEFKMSLS